MEEWGLGNLLGEEGGDKTVSSREWGWGLSAGVLVSARTRTCAKRALALSNLLVLLHSLGRAVHVHSVEKVSHLFA